MPDRDLQTPDGRTLRVQERGDPGGTPVLELAGTPNSRILYDADVALAERQGIRLIGYDRPGYGGSTRNPGRSVADCAVDVRAIAQALGIERLLVWGISGGGPHALACAALLEDLVPAVAVLGSPAPWGAAGLDYFAGMGELNVEDTRLYLADRAAAREKCEADRLEMLGADAEGLMVALQSLLHPVDAEALSGPLVEFFVGAIRDGLGETSDGWWDDGVAHMEPWGFELEAIRTPVLLVHGRHDRFVPFAHGEWLAAHVGGAEPMLLEDDGHLTLTLRHLEQIHDWLLARL